MGWKGGNADWDKKCCTNEVDFDKVAKKVWPCLFQGRASEAAPRQSLEGTTWQGLGELYFQVLTFLFYNISLSVKWENSEAVPENESRRGDLQRFEIWDDDETQRLLLLHNNNNHHNYHNNYNEEDD